MTEHNRHFRRADPTTDGAIRVFGLATDGSLVIAGEWPGPSEPGRAIGMKAGDPPRELRASERYLERLRAGWRWTG